MTQPPLRDGGSCRICGHGLEPTARVASATSGAVTVTVEGLPGLTCPNNHVTAASSPAFVADVVANVLGQARDRVIHFPRRRVGRQHCAVCGARLTMPPRQGRRSVTIDLESLPLFTATFEGPHHRCPSCGTDHLPPQPAVKRALAAALEDRPAAVPDA